MLYVLGEDNTERERGRDALGPRMNLTRYFVADVVAVAVSRRNGGGGCLCGAVRLPLA